MFGAEKQQRERLCYTAGKASCSDPDAMQLAVWLGGDAAPLQPTLAGSGAARRAA